jgi:hypothetical protein
MLPEFCHVAYLISLSWQSNTEITSWLPLSSLCGIGNVDLGTLRPANRHSHGSLIARFEHEVNL